MKKRAYRKDIIRTITHGKKRFFSILIIAALGVLVFTGLRAACVDLRQSADEFYDEQSLYDICIQSTLGLTDEDVEALGEVEGVSLAEGGYTETANLSGKTHESVLIKALSSSGLNEPYILEGELPKEADEIAVTRDFLNEKDLSIGDTITIEEDEDEESSAFLSGTEFTITAVVIDPANINNPEGSTAFRDTSTTDYTFFVSEEAIDSEIYTAVYLTVEEAYALNCYSDDYDELVEEVTERIENEVRDLRQEARTEEIRSQAQEEIDEAQETLDESLLAMTAAGYSEEAAAAALEEAQEEIDEAQAEADSIEEAVWYVQDRTSLSGFTNIDSDSAAIESIGNAFPVIFLAVAILISLTTITRMVEEERGLIGTYKALGFKDYEIRRKYMVYSLSAAVLGCIVGEAGGFILLPEIIFQIFQLMYSLPYYSLSFDWLYGLIGPAIFIVGVGLAAFFACRAALRQQPAMLMRPKAPKAGSRVFLERIKCIWKRLSFLNKVTVRNLFRYKKRLFMTIIGIMGCTAILVCAFAIKDSVADLSDSQYEEVYDYDLMVVAEDCEELMEETEDVESYISVYIDSVSIEYGDNDESVQLIVVSDEDAKELNTYINLTDIEDEESITLNSEGVFITRNAGEVLGFEAGEEVVLRDMALNEGEVYVEALAENYMGNNIYMTQSVYEEVFGEYEPNGALAMLSDSCTDPTALAEELSTEEEVTSATATEQLEEEFARAFTLINAVVYILIILAAALAFVVLFTLSATNISEREREIATIKVLGFYDREVHAYINKETMILTILGIIPGLILGTWFGHAMTRALDMPSIYFAVGIHPISYVYSAGFAIIFAILVQFITNRTLNAVDPVEALKSVE